MSIKRQPRIPTVKALGEVLPGQTAIVDDGTYPRLVHRRPDGALPASQGEADLAWVESRVRTLESPDHSPRTLTAAHWPDYTIHAESYTWTRLQSDSGDAPFLVVPNVVPARPGHHWEAQIEGFLRIGVTKPCTIYIGIQLDGATMGGVSGGKFFPTACDDLVPIMMRINVAGGEKIYFSIYTSAEGGDSIIIIPNPNPYLLIREVAW